MSVKELKFYPSAQTYFQIVYGTDSKQFGLRLMDSTDDAKVVIDYNQAHLLMLFLQEHLK